METRALTLKEAETFLKKHKRHYKMPFSPICAIGLFEGKKLHGAAILGRNAKGEAMVFEFLDDGGAMSRVITAYIRNLEKLGIEVNQRTTDFALYQKRLEDFDFDMVSIRFPDSQSPGNELRDRFTAEAAGTPGSDNLFGLKSPAVDKLVDTLLHARSRDELITAGRALDRVLMHGYYIVPNWYSAFHRVAYRKEMAYPTRLPYFYTAEGWILSNWWRNDLVPKTQ